jgi:hypothetical protein
MEVPGLFRVTINLVIAHSLLNARRTGTLFVNKAACYFTRAAYVLTL